MHKRATLQQIVSDHVDKVQKLIALSTSDSPEEARTAAHQACKLIIEHKLVVRERMGDAESSWLSDLTAKQDPKGRFAHLSLGGSTSLCGIGIHPGEGHYRIDHWPHIVPALKNCCLKCIERLISGRIR